MSRVRVDRILSTKHDFMRTIENVNNLKGARLFHPRPRVSCPLAEITARWYRFGTPGLKRTPNGNKQRPMCHVLFCALLTAKGRLVADCSKNLDNEHVESG
ncbi:hypothetical protein RRG08_023084 [Elysia crispata]|uniref:Uncharacterized protein n=1 Tax=Elysia crispata TaxID=231223 RepID=A0AAE1E3D3_9GAST|nr:hypothetical protein RRG08_023084 [Elysia crispata]